MERSTLGRTGLEVSRLGLGLAWIGLELTFAEKSIAAEVINTALDAEINFFDTSSCYGISEELIGLTVAHRRDEFIIATKCGHVTGESIGKDWAPQTIFENIELSLRRLKTDYLDIVQLHSCSIDILRRGEVVHALLEAQKSGKARFIGYSGDNEAAAWAIESGYFDTLQTSFNLIDQQARKQLFPKVKEKGIGLIIKRPIANAVWGATEAPSAYYQDYLKRAQEMASLGPIPNAPQDPILLAMSFTLAHPEVDTAIVGTKDPVHMRENLHAYRAGLSIPEDVREELYRRFEQLGQGWRQLS